MAEDRLFEPDVLLCCVFVYHCGSLCAMELNVKEITCEQQCHCFLSSKYISQVTEQQNKRWKRCYANNAKFHWKTSKSIALIHFKFVHPAYVPTFLFAVSVINPWVPSFNLRWAFVLTFHTVGDSSSTVKIILMQFVTQLWLQSIRGTVSQLKGFLNLLLIVSFLLIAHMKSLLNFVHGYKDNMSKNGF